MSNMLLCLLAGLFFAFGCDSTPDESANREAARKANLSPYMQQMAGPSVEARTYLSLYTTHKVECESGEPTLRRFNCTQAKVDLAHIERAWQQALSIAEQMAQDAALSDKDRSDASGAADQLRAGIGRIESAKSGKLPQL